MKTNAQRILLTEYVVSFPPNHDPIVFLFSARPTTALESHTRLISARNLYDGPSPFLLEVE